MSQTFIDGGVVRRLWPSDMPGFRDHLLRLDSQSRHDRFGGGVSDLFLQDYAEKCFGHGDIVYGYVVDGVVRGAGEMRGLARPSDAVGHRTVEAAFSVEIPHRRRGVGSEFLARIIRASRNRGADTIYMTCLADNRAMQKLAQGFAAELNFEADTVTGRLVGHPATPVSLWSEVFDDASSFMNALFDLQRRAYASHVPRPR